MEDLRVWYLVLPRDPTVFRRQRMHVILFFQVIAVRCPLSDPLNESRKNHSLVHLDLIGIEYSAAHHVPTTDDALDAQKTHWPC